MRSLNRFFRAGAVLAVLVGLVAPTRVGWAREVRITLLHTSDLHGRVLPFEFHRRQDQGGLAKVATLVSRIRAEQPNTLLIDTGDTIQGNEMAFYFNYYPRGVHPIIQAMNMLKFDVMVIGNHDFNFGPAIRDGRMGESKFPWIAANIRTETGRFLMPDLVKEVDGVRVGILGLVTPNIPQWEQPEFISGLTFRDTVQEAKEMVPELREKSDVVVVATHQGLELEPGKQTIENQVYRLAMEVPGIDAILAGHKHEDVPSAVVNGVVIEEPYKWGMRLGRVDLVLEGETGKGFKVKSATSTTLTVDEHVPDDPAILAMAQPYKEEMDRYFSIVVGTATGDFPAREARKKETALLDLTLKVLCEAGGVEVSYHDIWSTEFGLKQGPITIGDLFKIYFYEDAIYVVELTGQMLKDALELSAGLYGQKKDYEFAAAHGVSYAMDMTRPEGDRIVNLTYHGKPLDRAAKIQVAINSYQAQGGGGYKMFKTARLIKNTGKWVREAVIDYIKAHKKLEPVTDGTWSVIRSPR